MIAGGKIMLLKELQAQIQAPVHVLGSLPQEIQVAGGMKAANALTLELAYWFGPVKSQGPPKWRRGAEEHQRKRSSDTVRMVACGV